MRPFPRSEHMRSHEGPGPRERRQITASIPSRVKSMPAVLESPSKLELRQKAKRRQRFHSEDLHTRFRRFGGPLTVRMTWSEAKRRQIEVIIYTDCFRRSARPIVLQLELRRLLFWTCTLLLLASAGAFQLRGASVPTPSLRAAKPAPTGGVEPLRPARAAEPEADSSALPRGVVDALRDEASLELGKVGQAALGADPFEVSVLASHLLSLLSTGEFSVQTLKTVLSRACLSALVHKAVGAGATLATCLVHAT